MALDLHDPAFGAYQRAKSAHDEAVLSAKVTALSIAQCLTSGKESPELESLKASLRAATAEMAVTKMVLEVCSDLLNEDSGD